MNMETIRRINREALDEARKSVGMEPEQSSDNQMLVYAAAVVVGLLVYYLLHTYSPSFVMVTKDNVQTFDMLRAGLLSGASALAVVLGHHLYVNGGL
jgi:hypothetical protein